MNVENALVQGLFGALSEAGKDLNEIQERRIKEAEKSFLRLYDHVKDSPFYHLALPFESEACQIREDLTTFQF